MNVQRAKKVVSNSPGLVNIVLDLPKGQVKFFEEFKLQKNCVINPARQKFFRLVEMTFGLVHATLQLAQISLCKTDFLTP